MVFEQMPLLMIKSPNHGSTCDMCASMGQLIVAQALVSYSLLPNCEIEGHTRAMHSTALETASSRRREDKDHTSGLEIQSTSIKPAILSNNRIIWCGIIAPIRCWLATRRPVQPSGTRSLYDVACTKPSRTFLFESTVVLDLNTDDLHKSKLICGYFCYF